MLLRNHDEPWPAFGRRALLLLSPLIAVWLLLQLWNLAADARAHQRARASIHDGYARALQRCAADRPLQWDRCQAAADASRRAALQLAELRYKGTASTPATTVTTLAEAPQTAPDLRPVAWQTQTAEAQAERAPAATAGRTTVGWAPFGAH